MSCLTIAETAVALRAGEFSSVDLVTRLLHRADDLDPTLGVFLARFDEQALEAAGRADKELGAGLDRGPLHGIPVGVKDLISTADGPTTGQSLAWDPDWGRQVGDAEVVARLRAGGAVIVGKTTTMEFGYGLPDPRKPFPFPRNPWNLDTWAGGSSSGSASGGAAGLLLGALGTDEGGSIRLPAAWNGITSLRPTWGLIPTTGAIPGCPSQNVIGPMARSAWDCALLLTCMANRRFSDASSIDGPERDFMPELNGSLDGLRFGVAPELYAHGGSGVWADGEGTPVPGVRDPAVASLFEGVLTTLRAAGGDIVKVQIPFGDELSVINHLNSRAEAFVRLRGALQSRWKDLGGPARGYLTLGALVTAADYIQMQRIRQVARAAILDVFDHVDVVVTPTTMQAAQSMAAILGGAIGEAIPQLSVWSVIGFPAASVPMGMNEDNMPLGLQIIGPPGADGLVLRVADAYQRVTDWHRRVPSIEVGAA